MSAWLTGLRPLLRRILRESPKQWVNARWTTARTFLASTILRLAQALSALHARAELARRRLMSGFLPRAGSRLSTSAAIVWRFTAVNVIAVRRVVSALRIPWATPDAVRRNVFAVLSGLRSRWAMPKSLLALNGLLAGVSTVAVIWMVRALLAPDPLPPSTVPRPPAVVASAMPERGSSPRPPAIYDVVAVRTLFHPSRSEPTRTELVTKDTPPQPKPVLYGVVIGDDVQLAYLEDPATRRLFSYRTGDELAGGRLERIESDRVVISRADGPVEILLRGLNKPKRTESASAALPPEERRLESVGAVTPPPPDAKPFRWGGAFR